MKELTKKVVEAGLVPSQSIRLLKMWRCLPESLPEGEAEEKTQEQLLVFVEQISELLEDERGMTEMKETELDLQHLLDRDPCTVFAHIGDWADALVMTVGITRSGQLVFPVGDDGSVQEKICRRGTEIRIKDVVNIITHVEPRYVGDSVRFYLCNVVPRDA